MNHFNVDMGGGRGSFNVGKRMQRACDQSSLDGNSGCAKRVKPPGRTTGSFFQDDGMAPSAGQPTKNRLFLPEPHRTHKVQVHSTSKINR